MFAVCLQAEQVPATVQDYREKLLHLRKLRHDLVQPCLPKGPFHEVANALYYLLNIELFLKIVVKDAFVFNRFLFVILLQCCLSISDISGMQLLICWCKYHANGHCLFYFLSSAFKSSYLYLVSLLFLPWFNMLSFAQDPR